MRIIVEAFKDVLELGLAKPKQIVVREVISCVSVQHPTLSSLAAYDSYIRIWLANG